MITVNENVQRGIFMVNGESVFLIDNVPTIIKKVHGDVCEGAILNKDMTQTKTYVVRGHGFFAHGATIKEATQDLENKIMRSLDTDELKEKFMEKFKVGTKYSGHDFYEWHSYLTGSCKQGRDSFVSNKNINLDDTFTPEEFFKIVKGDYGWSVLNELAESMNIKV